MERSHRCNPLQVEALRDITDAAEASRTILLGLNQEWIKKQGDFWVESSINFLTAIIWYLRLYEDGKYCTLPHAVELVQTPFEKLFSILRLEPQVEALVYPFISAYLSGASNMLEGQIAGVTISLGKLSAPKLYYVLTGNDFSLDVNNPEKPKIVCIGNNPQKTGIYGAVLSLYTTALNRSINQKGRHKCSLIFDEFPTIYISNIDSLIATARSNKVAVTLAVQDWSQLKFRYGRDQAEVVLNVVGNIISGQVSGELAKHLSERFGKILQERESLSVNSMDTSLSKSKQLEMAVPPSRIASMSSGEFVGVVADNPDTEIELKAFHAKIKNNHAELKKEEEYLKPLPVISPIPQEVVLQNYQQVKANVQRLVQEEMRRMLNTDELKGLIIMK